MIQRIRHGSTVMVSRPVRTAASLLLAAYCFTGRADAEPMTAGHEDHSHHLAMMKQAQGYVRSEKKYVIPDVALTDMNGKSIRLRRLLDTDEPVVLQFIFTTCTTICPVLSATFSSAQEPLHKMGRPYRMVSITIDPEEDSPARLREYASRFGSESEWVFLTGAIEDIERVERAFDVYAPNNKMYHQPYTFLRARAGAPWVRIEGFMSASELVAEYRKMPSMRQATRAK